MNYLLDTCALIDIVFTPERLSFDDHGDPFDRLIICQAIHEKLPVITSDSKFSRYHIDVIW